MKIIRPIVHVFSTPPEPFCPPPLFVSLAVWGMLMVMPAGPDVWWWPALIDYRQSCSSVAWYVPVAINGRPFSYERSWVGYRVVDLT